MNRFSLLLLAAAGVPLLVHAQAVRTPAPVTDPNATVPALQYQSVFTGQPATPESASTPDKVWVQANRDVAGGSGHGAHGAHGTPDAHGGAAAAPAPAPAPATQAAPTTPAAPPAPDSQAKPAQPPVADPHKDHKGHQGHQGHDMNKKGH